MSFLLYFGQCLGEKWSHVEVQGLTDGGDALFHNKTNTSQKKKITGSKNGRMWTTGGNFSPCNYHSVRLGSHWTGRRHWALRSTTEQPLLLGFYFIFHLGEANKLNIWPHVSAKKKKIVSRPTLLLVICCWDTQREVCVCLVCLGVCVVIVCLLPSLQSV